MASSRRAGRRRAPPARAAVLLALVLLSASFSAACVSVPLVQRLLPARPVPVESFRDQTLTNFTHRFTTDYGALLAGDSAAFYRSVTFARDDSLNVTSGSQWLRLDLNASFDSIPPAARDLLRQTCQQVAGLDCSLEPSLRIRLSTPDGELWFDENYTSQTSTFLHVESPMAGSWLLQATATGYSASDAHDSIDVAAVAREPSGPRHG